MNIHIQNLPKFACGHLGNPDAVPCRLPIGHPWGQCRTSTFDYIRTASWARTSAIVSILVGCMSQPASLHQRNGPQASFDHIVQICQHAMYRVQCKCRLQPRAQSLTQRPASVSAQLISTTTVGALDCQPQPPALGLPLCTRAQRNNVPAWLQQHLDALFAQ